MIISFLEEPILVAREFFFVYVFFFNLQKGLLYVLFTFLIMIQKNGKERTSQ
jgi:hypothetical protein